MKNKSEKMKKRGGEEKVHSCNGMKWGFWKKRFWRKGRETTEEGI